jgi:uncharacterized phage protein gp47/JayE
MNEIPTYEEILQRCLDRIPNTIDKRQGSIIYDALAPCCVELAQMYIELSGIYDQVFIDTAVGEALDKLVEQNGVKRKDATYALRKGEFNMVVPVDNRFSDGENTYIVIENIAGTNNSILRCEQAGAVGNSYYGSLTPITYLQGLTKAELTDIIDMGDDIESDEDLRVRYMESVTAPEFGGNVSDYQNKVKSLTGVGGCKVVPIWNGGGTVKLIITNSQGGVPTSSLVNDVQEAVDPNQDQQGLGIAPIGHIVTVEGAVAKNITVSATFTLESGVDPTDIQDSVNNIVDNYFKSLSTNWDKEDNLIARISQLETRLLGVAGVLDITNTKMNNSSSNLSLESNEIPVREGDVVINV